MTYIDPFSASGGQVPSLNAGTDTGGQLSAAALNWLAKKILPPTGNTVTPGQPPQPAAAPPNLGAGFGGGPQPFPGQPPSAPNGTLVGSPSPPPPFIPNGVGYPGGSPAATPSTALSPSGFPSPMSINPPAPAGQPQSTAWPANAGQGQPASGLVSNFVNALRGATPQQQQTQQPSQGMLPRLFNDIGSIGKMFGGSGGFGSGLAGLFGGGS